MVEYPRPGLYALGFVTADSPAAVTDETGQPTQNVYFPNSPNPTNGHMALIPENQVTPLDMSVSRGIRLLVTTGIAESKEEIAELQGDEASEGTDPEGLLEPESEP